MRYFLVLVAALLVSCSLQAQSSVSLSFNVANQPVWGPIGYDHVEFYYLPEIETYYSVPRRQFFYFEGGRWIGTSSLPPRYRDYDLYHSYKVVVNEQTPYRNHKKYKDQYSSYKDRHDQELIRDSRDSKYFVNKHHPEHGKWMKEQKHEKSKGNKMDKGKKSERK